MGNGASASKAQVAVTNLEADAKNNELDAPIQPTVQIKKAKTRQVEVKAVDKPAPTGAGESKP